MGKQIQVQEVVKTVEVPQIQYMEKVIDVPVIKTVEQIIEIPRVEYQDVQGETSYMPVDYGVVRQVAPSTFAQERVVGPDLETTVTSVMQAEPVMMQAPMTSFVQPQVMAAPMTSFVQPTMAAPTTMMAAPTTS